MKTTLLSCALALGLHIGDGFATGGRPHYRPSFCHPLRSHGAQCDGGNQPTAGNPGGAGHHASSLQLNLCRNCRKRGDGT